MQDFETIIDPVAQAWREVRHPSDIHDLLTGVQANAAESFADDPDYRMHAEAYLDALLHTARHYELTDRRASLGAVAMATALDGPIGSPAAESVGVVVRSLISLELLGGLEGANL